MFGEDPVELGMADMEDELLRAMRDDERYPEMFCRGVPDEIDPISPGQHHEGDRCLPAALTSFNSRYDRWQARDATALNQSEQRGLACSSAAPTQAGVEDAFECFHCHGGFLFSQASDDDGRSSTRSSS